MSAPSLSIDATSKRWLAALALAFLVAVTVLTRSFINTLSPTEKDDAKVRQAASDRPKEVRTVSQAEWIRSDSFHAVEEQASPSAPIKSDAAIHKKNAAVAKEAVHNQAECLRSLVKQNKLPKAYGRLTLEQIDEMEKEGITIQ